MKQFIEAPLSSAPPVTTRSASRVPDSMTHPRLEMLPEEAIEDDRGCGDLSAYVRPGDVVLDLRSAARMYHEDMAHKLGGDPITCSGVACPDFPRATSPARPVARHP